MEQYEKMKNKQDMQQQIYVFVSMIFFITLSFLVVTLNFHPKFVVPFILLLALVQVGLQLAYFMHLKERGYGVIWTFLATAGTITFVTVLAFAKLVWW